MNDIFIRPATPQDLQTLLTFEQGIIAAERPFDPTLKDGHIHYYNLQDLIDSPDAELAVAELNNEVIACGYARIKNSKPYLKHAQHAYLGFMYVVPMHRGKGINQQVIEHLKQWALSKKVHELRLEVYVENASAIQAYQKIGFTKHMIEMRLPI